MALLRSTTPGSPSMIPSKKIKALAERQNFQTGEVLNS